MMYITHRQEEVFWTARDEVGGYSIGGKHTSMGAALEACVRHLSRGTVTKHPITVWECVGNSSYTSTALFHVCMENERIVIDNPPKKAT